MSGLTLDGISKAFGEAVALRGLSLEAAEGELLVLVGASGAGKTTALRVAAGLERPDAGRVLIGERDVTALAPAKRNAGMVFQGNALFPHLTAGENIGFGLRARRMRGEEARLRILEAAALAGCEEILERHPYELSAAGRHRVALARALARHPDVFLLDEPLSGLDAQTRAEARADIGSLHRRLEATVVCAIQDPIEALAMGDRVAVIREGALEQVGTPEEIYGQPVNKYVAVFTGTPAINIVPVTHRAGRFHAGPFTFAMRGADERHSKHRLEMGIRPEHFQVSITEGAVVATVALVEVAGPDTFLHVDAGDLRLVVRTSGPARPRLGSEVRLAVRRANTLLFDAETGRTLT